MDDQEILRRLRAGDEAAFDAVFRAHYGSLVQVAYGVLADRSAAEDVAQDILLEVWRRREKIVAATSLRAYLVRAARNRALNEIRHAQVTRRADPSMMKPQAPALADRDTLEGELDAALQNAVRELPERCREVFELSRVHGLSYAETADVLGISIKTVEGQMGKALRVLRERLARWLPGGA